jgi:ribonucleoside-diphosphate reductase beta chain
MGIGEQRWYGRAVGVVGYGHFLALAERVRWDERTIDLRSDAALWADERERLLATIAGFCVAETAVAEELTPVAAAAGWAGSEMRACFEAQQRDERRHARFFARVAREVVGVEPDALRAHADPEWRDRFEVQLPAVARAGCLVDAVGLYHMVLEGVVLTQALHTLIDGPLPGLAHGAALILRDERWHIGFGVRCLRDAGLTAPVEARILESGLRAGGDLTLLRRRLAVAR